MPSFSEPTLCYTHFTNIYDNVAISTPTTWSSFVEMITHGHPVTTEPKSNLPAINAWRYKNVDDPTLDHGKTATGKPRKRFMDKWGKPKVRRLSSNLLEMSMLIIDFDGNLPLEAVRDRFGAYEFICYTSINHRVEGKDKFRLISPFTHGMPVTEFKPRIDGFREWIDGNEKNVADEATYSLGQMFILPAVRPEGTQHAKIMHNIGDWLNWEQFAATGKTPKAASKENSLSYKPAARPILRPDDSLYTAEGCVTVKDIDHKISKVKCPFHEDRNPTEFVAVTSNGLPFLHCKRCGTIYMEHSKEDPIIEHFKRKSEKKVQGEKEAE